MNRIPVLTLGLLLLSCKADKPNDDPAPHPTEETVPEPTGADLTELSIGSVAVTPDFRPDVRYYSVRASDLTSDDIIATPFDESADVEVFIETPDGELLSSGPTTRPEANQRVRVHVNTTAGDERTYSVAVLSDEFPVRTIEGKASEGWTFLTSTFKEPNGTIRTLMVVDSNGSPGWWREVNKPASDLRVAPDGRLTWMGRTAENQDDLQNLVLSADGQEMDVALTASEPGPDWTLTQVDEHEWYLLEDGTGIRMLNYRVTEDLSPWDGPTSQRVEHQVAQHVDLDGTVLFEFSTEGLVPYDELPPNLYAEMDELDWEPIHFNSLDIDPEDGHWVISMHRVSMVVKVARTGPQAGQVLWQLGGESSDFTFVDDTRPTGWTGFGGQHSVRVTGPNRIEMFDNANGDDQAVGDMRIVEYQLDLDAMTASIHSEHVWTGRGRAFAGGSVQSLANGNHLVGFGSVTTDANGERVPSVSELDAEGNEIWSLTLNDKSWSYRAWRFEGDPMEWSWTP